MEDVDAPDLSVHRDPGGYFADPKQRHRIALDSVSALLYIHDQGLRHNDIKPANILFSPERGAVICDFGLACPDKVAWRPCGTPGYLAPELLTPGSPVTGSASDVWALGITLLYVMREIELPEKNARWVIAELGCGVAADEKMRKWLQDVIRRRDDLQSRLKNDELDEPHGYVQAVIAMLDDIPRRRKPLRDISTYLK